MKEKRYTLSKKIQKLNFLGFLSMIVICLLGFALISTQMYMKQAVEFCNDTVQLNLNVLNNRLLQIQEGQRWLTEDPQVKHAIQYREEHPQIDYSIELYNQRDIVDKFQNLARNTEIDNAYIINREKECLYSYKGDVIGEKLQTQKWFQDIIDNVKLNISYISQIHDKSYLLNPSQEQCISMLMPIENWKDGRLIRPKAYLVCDINLEEILSDEASDISFAILDQKHTWYSFEDFRNQQEIERWVQEVGSSEEKEAMRTVRNGALIVSEKLNNFNLQLIGIKELDEIRNLQRNIAEVCAGVVVVAIILSVVISKITMQSILKPVRRLMAKCNEVSRGKYDTEFGKEEVEEIAVLSDTIHGMITNIVYLNQKMIEEEQKFSEQKLRALQHQINPHFMNNVLQAIKGLALRGETQKISSISTYLGKMMSYSVYRPYETVTIGQELEHVKNYLEVQNIRFDNTILYSIECDPEVEKVKTLKLTLQPLVENAVEHGHKTQVKQFISISADMEGDMVCVIINDNGRGISEEKMKELQAKLKTAEVYEQEKSVGILNVNERIRKKYGEEYGIELNSKEECGTTVIVKLPKQ